MTFWTYGSPLGAYSLGWFSVLLTVLVIDGSALVFVLCWLLYVCIHGEWIILWSRLFLGILSQSIWGSPFGLSLTHLSFHWEHIRCFCCEMRLLATAWSRQMVYQSPWLVFLLYYWFSSLSMRHGKFFFGPAYLWGFNLFSFLVKVLTLAFHGVLVWCLNWGCSHGPSVFAYKRNKCNGLIFVWWMTMRLCFMWQFPNELVLKCDILSVPFLEGGG